MRIYPVFIPHSGCSHRCLFCAQDRSTSYSVAPSAVMVDAMLDKALPAQGDGEVAFYGGTFTLLPQIQQDRYLDVAARYIADGRISGTRCSTRPDALDEECLSRLRAAGVTSLEIGCQSFNDAVLKATDRGHTASDNIAAIQACQAAGLQVGVQLMPGLPGGDAAEALASLRQVLKLKPSFLRIYPTVVVDGTALAELWRNGHYNPWTLDDAVEVCADMLRLCRQHDLPIIRIGLQSDPQLEENLLAGPYHPAFGQLVRSRLWRRALLRAGSNSQELIVNPSDLSDVLGHRRENLDTLKLVYPEISVTSDQTVERGFLRMSDHDSPLCELSAQGD